MLKGRGKFIITIGIIAISITYLVLAGVKETMVYYLTIDELKQRVPAVYKEKVRVSGEVVTGSIINDTEGNLGFKITDGNHIINVEYKGIVPDVFRDGVEAVVEGLYKPDNTFKADILLAKCPTKYESTESLEKGKNT
jgi:cytochrome c-type biogenesis protein CcmE